MEIDPGSADPSYTRFEKGHVWDAIGNPLTNDQGVSPADARLIAAAPELLALLQARLDVISWHECTGYCSICAARDLIRRIEGEE